MISGEDALRDSQMAGKGNNLASPPYFCRVSLDARGTGDTPLGELGKYEEGVSGKYRLDQIIANHAKDSLIYLCLSWDLSSSYHSPCLY